METNQNRRSLSSRVARRRAGGLLRLRELLERTSVSRRRKIKILLAEFFQEKIRGVSPGVDMDAWWERLRSSWGP